MNAVKSGLEEARQLLAVGTSAEEFSTEAERLIERILRKEEDRWNAISRDCGIELPAKAPLMEPPSGGRNRRLRRPRHRSLEVIASRDPRVKRPRDQDGFESIQRQIQRQLKSKLRRLKILALEKDEKRLTAELSPDALEFKNLP